MLWLLAWIYRSRTLVHRRARKPRLHSSNQDWSARVTRRSHHTIFSSCLNEPNLHNILYYSQMRLTQQWTDSRKTDDKRSLRLHASTWIVLTPHRHLFTPSSYLPSSHKVSFLFVSYQHPSPYNELVLCLSAFSKTAKLDISWPACHFRSNSCAARQLYAFYRACEDEAWATTG